MKVKYKNRKIEKICTNASTAEKECGIDMAKKIHQRIDEIMAAEIVDILINGRIGKCHSLIGKRTGQYSMVLVQPKRLIFTVDKNEIVQIAEIVEVVDYH